MTQNFKATHAKSGLKEAGYVNNPNDLGGATNRGVTHITAKRYGYVGDMRLIPEDLCERIFYEDYWRPMNLEAVSELSLYIAQEMYDSAINMTGRGGAKIVRWLQAALNNGNRQQKDYADIRVDGQLGKKTITALTSFLKKRGVKGEIVILLSLNGEQISHYNSIATGREKNEDFWFGWLWNRVALDLIERIELLKNEHDCG